jgi:hypothetical protein
VGAEFARLEIGSFKITQICFDKFCAIIAKFKRFSVWKLGINLMQNLNANGAKFKLEI